MMVDLEKLYETHASEAAKKFVENTRTALREHFDRFYEVAKIVRRLDPASILDAPCGTGVLLDVVSHVNYRPRRVVGVDISATNCQIARTLYGHDVLELDLLHYYPADKFELVMCMELLEHLHNAPIYVKKALSLSSRWALFSVPVESGSIDGTYHVRKIHPTELREWVENAGGVLKEMWMLPSLFCEKPHWLGWMYVLAEVEKG